MAVFQAATPRVTLRSRAPGTAVSVEVDTRLPGSPLGRKVYKTRDRSWRMPRPHAHDSPHHLICAHGVGLLAVRPDPQLPPRIVEIPAGTSLVVPGRLPHQLGLEPQTVVSSFFPPRIWLSTNENLVFFDEDWLT